MANYANLQEAIDAGTSNMKQEAYKSASLSRFYIDHWIPTYIQTEYKGSSQRYHTLLFGDSNCKYVIGSGSYSYEEDIVVLSEYGYINGHYFNRVHVTLPTIYSYGHVDTITEFFFFDTCQIFVRNIQPDLGSSSLKTSVEQVDITFTNREYSEFTFSPEDTDNGTGWSAEEGRPTLPDIPDPSEAPVPTIVYNFQKNARYRAKVRTWYLPPTGSKKSIESEPSEEFTGTDVSGFYTTIRGFRIDKNTLEVWSSQKTDLKATIRYEGDLKGLHYKAYDVYDDNPNEYYGVVVITGTQTDRISVVTEWPFMNDPDTPPHYVTMYCDATLTDMDYFFWNNDRLGVNGQITGEISYSTFQHPGDWGHMACLDNISKTRINCNAQSIFRSQHLGIFGEIGVERIQRFFDSLDFPDTFYNNMFRDGGLYASDQRLEFDFSFLHSSYSTDIGYLLYRCRDVYGKVDLRNLMISNMQYAFYYTGVEEVLFKTTENAGTLSSTGLNHAFESSANLKRVDLSGFSFTTGLIRAVSTFSGCTSLEFIDMTGMKLNCNLSEYVTNFLRGCTNLKEFRTPNYTGNYPPALPITMYDSEGNEYTSMPANKTIYATNPVG